MLKLLIGLCAIILFYFGICFLYGKWTNPLSWNMEIKIWIVFYVFSGAGLWIINNDVLWKKSK